MIETAKLVFFGQFRPSSFLDFIRHRAVRLALYARPESVRDDMVEVCVSGESDLVDAFEVACTLGPIDCLVRDHRRERLTTPLISTGHGNNELRSGR
jgi:acylphosphatase